MLQVKPSIGCSSSEKSMGSRFECFERIYKLFKYNCKMRGNSIFYFIYFLFVLYNNFFFIIAGLQCSVNFLLYSMVTQLHIHV